MRHRISKRKGGIVTCLLLFIATLGLGILLTLAYDLWNRPAWLAFNTEHISKMELAKIEIAAGPADMQKAQSEAAAKAKAIWRQRLRKTAMEQFDVAYGWASLDGTTRKRLSEALDKALHAETLDAIKTVDRYADWIGERVFVLYGMESAEIDSVLQRIYESVNKAMLAAMGFGGEHEIEPDENEKKDTNETAK